jgi:hypothetical protein
MTPTKPTSSEANKSVSQLDKFKEAARQLETDDDPERSDERMRKLLKQKPVDKSG